MATSLSVDLPSNAWTHAEELEEVKMAVGVRHRYFDHWIYSFLENKKFDVEETIAKLFRRADMEQNELASLEIDDWMVQNLRTGTIQIVGEDKEGRLIFYCVTCRDFPTSDRRDLRRRNFDMWLSYGTRLRRGNLRCKICLLVNQRDAGIWANTDMTFQSNIALRIAKYYPGCVDRILVCCMGAALATFAKPIIGKLPAAIRDTTFIFTEKEVMQEGKLLTFMEKDVIPVALGGTNECDTPEHWAQFADTVIAHFKDLQNALRSGQSAKEWEMERVMEEERKIQMEEILERSALRRNKAMSEAASSTGGGPASVHRLNDSTGALQRSMDVEKGKGLAASQTQVFDPERDYPRFTLEEDGESGAIELRPCRPTAGHRYSVTFDEDPNNDIARLEDLEYPPTTILELFEDQEQFLRKSLEEMEEYHRIALAEESGVAMTRRNIEENEVQGEGASRLARRCPAPMRSVVRGLLWGICVVMALYFTFGTLVLAGGVGALITIMFVALFSDAFYIFPVGLALLLTAHQGCLIGTRGFELVKSAFRGDLIRPLKLLPPPYGTVIQVGFYVILILTQIVAFIVYAVYFEPLTALSVGFAAGWVPCTVVVLLYHFLFPIGLRGEDPEDKAGRSSDAGSLSLYLFFDLTEPAEDNNPKRTKRSSAMILAIPVALCVLFGISFIATSQLPFLIVAVAVCMFTAFTTNYVVQGGFEDHTSNLVRSATWMITVQWQYSLVLLGFMGFAGDEWSDSIGLSFLVVIVFIALVGGVFLLKPEKSDSATRRWYLWMMRGSYLYLALVVLGGVGSAFAVHWGLGLYSFVFMAHSAFCFIRPSSVTMVGRLIVTLASTALLLAVMLLGYASADPVDEGSLRWVNATSSLQLQGASPLAAAGDLSLLPICLRSWSLGSLELSATDLAILTFAAGSNSSFMEGIFQKWFNGSLTSIGRIALPDRFLTVNLITPVEDWNRYVESEEQDRKTPATPTPVTSSPIEVSEGSNATSSPQKSLSSNVTERVIPLNNETGFAKDTDALPSELPVLAVVSSPVDRFRGIKGMVMWVESLAFAPLALVLPRTWTVIVVEVASFLEPLLPFEWEDSLEYLTTILQRVSMNGNRSTLVVGHSFGGGMASVVGSKLHLPTVEFSSPGLYHIYKKFDLNLRSVDEYVTSIVVQSAAIAGVDHHGDKEQVLECDRGPVDCQSQLAGVCGLIRGCGTQHHSLVPSC